MEELVSVARRLEQSEDAPGLCRLARSLRDMDLSKSRMARVLKLVLDGLARLQDTWGMQLDLVNEMTEWAYQSGRLYLQLHLRTKQVEILFQTGQFQQCLDLAQGLIRELRRIDDRAMLLEVQLLESRVYYGLGLVSKSRASLTAAKTLSNAIYCPPAVQASMDLQSGILHAHDGDYRTAYSYFCETFETQCLLKDTERAKLGLRYMLFVKIMMGEPEDVFSLASTKGASLNDSSIEAMMAVATAYKNRSLRELETIRSTWRSELSDPMVSVHLDKLFDTLVERNLNKLIEPYSRVELPHLARLIGLAESTVEMKLARMILDHKLSGTIDQRSGHLVVLPSTAPSTMLDPLPTLFQQMDLVVNALGAKASALREPLEHRMSKGDKRSEYFQRVQALFRQYDRVILFDVDNVSSSQMHRVRAGIRNEGVLLMGKNTLIQKAMEGLVSESSGLAALKKEIRGNVGLVFTSGEIKEVCDKVVSYRVSAPAKTGSMAPRDVFVPAGNTGQPPDKTGVFQALGISTKVVKGAVEILNGVCLIKEGDRVGASEVELLSLLGILPFDYGCRVRLVYDQGSIYGPEVLKITPERILGALQGALERVAALSLGVGIPTMASVRHCLLNGFRDVIAVSLASEYHFPGSTRFIECSQPQAAAAVVPAAEEAKKEAESESEEDDGGAFAMFG